MFAVIFEVQPKAERFEDYLALAKQLKPKLEAIDGFIDNERFESQRTKGRLLSLSIWRDEKSVIRWRTQGEHHRAQEKGRFEVFEDYHLRVGEIVSDTAPPEGLPVRQQRFDVTETGTATFTTLTELTPGKEGTPAVPPEALLATLGLETGAAGLVEHDVFESITSKGKMILLASWRDEAAANAWTPAKPSGVKSMRHRAVRVIRDYGMFERREAPQYYPEVKRARSSERAA